MASYPSNDDHELRMAILGKTGCGKSATANSILGIKHFESKLWGISVTKECKLGTARRFGKNIILVDTPGLFDTLKSNADMWKEICKCIGMTTPGPHAILLVITPGRFTEEEKKTVDFLENALGDGMFKYLIVVFTNRDELERQKTTIERYLENCPHELKEILQKCDKQYIAIDNYTEEKRDDEANNLISMVQDITAKNGGSHYTCEMYKEAETRHQMREEELRKQYQREKEEDRKRIEAKCKKEMDEKCNELQKQVEEAKKRAKDTENDMERQKTEKERIKWEAEIEKQRREYVELKDKYFEEINEKYEEKNKNIRHTIRREYEEEKGVFEKFGSGVDIIGEAVCDFSGKAVGKLKSIFLGNWA